MPDRVSSHHPGAESPTPLTFEFRGGIDQSKASHRIPFGSLRKLTNMYYPNDQERPKTRPGAVKYQTGTAADGKVTGVHVFFKDSSTRHVLFTAIDAVGTGQELFYLDGAKAKVKIGDLPTTNPPSFETFSAWAMMALGGGEPIHLWQGFTSGSEVKATGTVLFSSNPADGDTVTIGSRTYTFKSAGRAQPGEVAIAGTAALTRDNLVAAMATDQWDATGAASGADVAVTAQLYGAVGNTIVLSEASTALTVSGSTLSGGADGMVIEKVETYQHPHPSMLGRDKNGRLLAAGDPAEPDRLFLSSPTNPISFAYGNYGSGEYWDFGYKEGNILSAIASLRDEILIHKRGKNREVHRFIVSDTSVGTWAARGRFLEGSKAAVNHRAVLSIADGQIALDRKSFHRFYGVEQYDEYRSDNDGLKVLPMLLANSQTEAFIVHNPDDNYALVFPSEGRFCLCYHYLSRRWSSWMFSSSVNYTCGDYDEDRERIYLGGDDGFVHELDPDVFQDHGVNFDQVIQTKGELSADMLESVIKQTIFDISPITEGAGTIYVLIDGDSGQRQKISDFSFDTTGIYVVDATMDVVDATFDVVAAPDAVRSNSFQIASGGTIALEITINSGGIEATSAMLRPAVDGRILN